MYDEILTIDHPAREIPEQEFFDNRTQMFITVPAHRVPAIHLQLVHSLMSISKWESRWHTSFMSKENMTGEEFLDYIRCMTINPQKNQDVYKYLTQEDFEIIGNYIQDPMSAFVVKKKGKKPPKNRRQQDTVEAVYYAMINLGIPMDLCQKWHFNRLSALIDYCADNGMSGMAGTAGRPKSQREMMEMYHALNQKNRKKYNSKG